MTVAYEEHLGHQHYRFMDLFSSQFSMLVVFFNTSWGASASIASIKIEGSMHKLALLEN